MIYTGKLLKGLSDNEVEFLSQSIANSGALYHDQTSSLGRPVYAIFRASNGGLYIKTLPLLGNTNRLVFDNDKLVVGN
jgi:hypothetical protein